MKNLIYKEFKLASHPTMWFFPLFAAMLIIPSYPYYVAYMYTCLSIFLVFITARENKDVFFTVSLPVRKRDAVRARMFMVVAIEVFQVIFSIPFALLSVRINPLGGNSAGMDCNVALFGFVFVMYAIFNIIFLPVFYKTAIKPGVAFLWGGCAVMLYIGIMEVAVAVLPFMKALDTSAPAAMVGQLPILAAGIVIYAGLTLLAYKLAVDRFEKVDV